MREFKSNNYHYCKAGRVITSLGAIEKMNSLIVRK